MFKSHKYSESSC